MGKAAQRNQLHSIETVKYLIEHGAPVDESAVENAIDSRNLECLKYLHEHGYAQSPIFGKFFFHIQQSRKFGADNIA